MFYGLPGALVGYLVGMLVAPFIPGVAGSCSADPQAEDASRDGPADEGRPGTDADAA